MLNAYHVAVNVLLLILGATVLVGIEPSIVTLAMFFALLFVGTVAALALIGAAEVSGDGSDTD